MGQLDRTRILEREIAALMQWATVAFHASKEPYVPARMRDHAIREGHGFMDEAEMRAHQLLHPPTPDTAE